MYSSPTGGIGSSAAARDIYPFQQAYRDILAPQDRFDRGLRPVRRAVVWAAGALGVLTQEELEEEERREEIATRIGTIHVLLELLLLEIVIEQPEEPNMSVEIVLVTLGRLVSDPSVQVALSAEVESCGREGSCWELGTPPGQCAVSTLHTSCQLLDQGSSSFSSCSLSCASSPCPTSQGAGGGGVTPTPARRPLWKHTRLRQRRRRCLVRGLRGG